MEGLQRTEYPAMLARMSPAGASSTFQERVALMQKVNTGIADWMAERRRIEDEYVASLKRLAQKPLETKAYQLKPKDLGVFEHSWSKINQSLLEIASSHNIFGQQVKKDIEEPLRMSSELASGGEASKMGANLSKLAVELKDSEDKYEKLKKKGGKAPKLDGASKTLDQASSQWDAQSPFMFEKLQEWDENRLIHLRDILTQFETLEADRCERERPIAEPILGILLDIDTAMEVQSWSHSIIEGQPMTERHARQLSNAGSANNTAAAATLPPPTPRSGRTTQTDHSNERTSETSNRFETFGEKPMKKSIFGTMLGKRRQSIHGGFQRASSPSKGSGSGSGSNFPRLSSFTRSSSRDGRPGPSPRASSGNLRASPAPDNQLATLPESPRSQEERRNGVNPLALITDNLPVPFHSTNGTASPDISNLQPPPGPPHSQLKSENRTDSEGFTVPSAMNDPISQAQLEAADGAEQQFKVDIQKDPIPEQDADAQEALSNVANTLRTASFALTPNRKTGTVRGRRDVRNTVYLPSNSLDVSTSENPLPPPSPGLPVAAGRAAALAALSSGENAPPPSSDTISNRSGRSLSNNVLAKHTEMHEPGLNASIIETVNATLEAGEVTTSKISGEIALVYNKSDPSDTDLPINEIIRINNFTNLEAIGPNRTFMHPVSDEKPDEYSVDIAAVTKSAIAFTYKVHMEEIGLLAASGPLLLKLRWKVQENKIGLIVEYRLNPAYDEHTLVHNLIILGFSTGPKPTACQSKPACTLYKEKSLVVWQLGNVTLSHAWRKLTCRLDGSSSGGPQPGHVEARWELHNIANTGSGITISRLQPNKGKEKEKEEVDPFADESVASPGFTTPPGNWLPIETSKKLVGGRYEAK